jgi:hypothetical protein
LFFPRFTPEKIVFPIFQMPKSPFQQSYYDKYDDLGKNTLISFLRFKDHLVPENQEEAYSHHDIYSIYDNTPVYWEVEVCGTWTDGHLQYKNRSVPTRKQYNSSDFYVVVNTTGTRLGFTDMSIVQASPIIHKNTTRSTDEPFFNVPTSNFRWYKKEGDAWVKYDP